MRNLKEKHLIIGAGPVGLAHAKALKEAGIPYDQVEADDNVGGNWYHGVYDSAHIISSKKVTEYADFPMPNHYPDFPSASQMFAYYVLYADTFNLRENIEFNALVIAVEPIENNYWKVTFEQGEERIYKGVLACNGHHWDCRLPTFKGHFNGEIIHSKAYKNRKQLEGKRVLVIGSGNSACDIAAEAARVGQSVHMSLRSGTWFLPKTFLGRPISDSTLAKLPLWVQRIFLKMVLKIVVGHLKNYGLPQPNYKIFDKHPTLSTDALYYIKHGKIKPKPAIEALCGDAVLFEDGTKIPFDLIVAATGYHLSYPFLPEGLQRVKGVVAQVYAGSLLEDYKGLYLIGWGQPRGGVGSLVTPGAALLARFIKLQNEINMPLGLVFKKMGLPLPKTHLMDPYQVLRQIRRANQFFSVLERYAKNQDKKTVFFQNKPLEKIKENKKIKMY